MSMSADQLVEATGLEPEEARKSIISWEDHVNGRGIWNPDVQEKLREIEAAQSELPLAQHEVTIVTNTPAGFAIRHST